jgi:uncharacterized RDD family membrane protein YckC
VSRESPYPTLANRLFAAAADWGIVLIIASLLTAAFGRPVPDFGEYVWLVPFTALVGWLYFAPYESGRRGATPMKKVMMVRVAYHRGGRLVFWRASLRQLVKMLPLLVAIIVLGPALRHGYFIQRKTWQALGIFAAVFALVQLVLILRKRGRTLHDLLSGSIVLRMWESDLP